MRTGYLVAGGLVAALAVGSLLFGARVRDQVAATVQTLTTQPESTTGSALYGRHQAQREAVTVMRADLLRLVAAESAFVADSGHPTAFLPPSYWLQPSPGIVGPTIRIGRDGWWATVSSQSSTISCAVAVGADTSLIGALSGTPVCSGALTPRWLR